MRMARILTAFMAAIVMLLVFGGNDQINCVPTPEEEACSLPLDCEGLPHPSCAGHWSCAEGACLWQCKEKPPAPGCCNSDNDCGDNQVCIGDTCETAPKAGECWSDADCNANQECIAAINCPCGALCFAATQVGTCEPVAAGCYDEEDCGFAQTCHITNDCCSPEGCVPGAPCPDVCVPCGVCEQKKSECSADDDCPKANECLFEEECPDCVYANPPCKAPCYAWGKCVPLPNDCLNDAECDDGQICELETYCPPCIDNDPPCLAPCWAQGQCVDPSNDCPTIDVNSFGFCEMLLGVGFDGNECKYVSGCGCDDSCDSIFQTMEACLKACE